MSLLVLATDGFQRADANPLNGNWFQPSAWFSIIPTQIVSHVCEPTGNGSNTDTLSNATTWPNDQFSTVKVNSYLTGDYIGVLLRAASGVGGYRIFYGVSSTLGYIVQKYTYPSTFADLNIGVGSTPQPGDTITGVIQGNQISVLVNGVNILTVTDSSFSSGAPGFMLVSGSVVSDASIASWSGGTLGNGGVSNSLTMLGCGT